jgi:hypothetical protein
MLQVHQQGVSYWLGAYHRVCRVFSKRLDLFGTKMMLLMNFISDPQSVLARSLSSLCSSAISKTFVGFCPAYLLMKAKKRVIPGGSAVE